MSVNSGGSHGHQQSWRSQDDAELPRRNLRRMKRILVSLLAIGLLALFALLLFRPFWHSNALLIVLSGPESITGSDDRIFAAPPIDYVSEDFSALDSLSAVLMPAGPQGGPVQLENLTTPDALRQLGKGLDEAIDRGCDVLMVYVRAHGVSQDGVAQLVWNFDSQVAPHGRYSLDDLLRQLTSRPAAVKLLILDAGSFDADPQQGMLVNEFARLLEQSVHETSDAHLWVLSSHSLLEKSHISRAMERSVFGFFVTRGLKGAADLNDNRVIDLQELHRYVSANVASWVEQSTGETQTQTPQLFWGGGFDRLAADFPTLVPVNKKAKVETESNDHTAAIRTVQSTSQIAMYYSGVYVPTSGTQAVSYSPVGQALYRSPLGSAIYHVQSVSNVVGAPSASRPASTATSSTASGGSSTEGTPGSAAGADNQPAATAKPVAGADAAAADDKGKGTSDSKTDSQASASSKKADSKAGSDSSKKTGDKGKSASDSESDDAAAESEKKPVVPGLLAECWRLHDELEARTAGKPSPVDYAPQLWRAIELKLLRYEQMFRSGRMHDETLLVDAIEAMVALLKDAKNRPEELPARRSPLAGYYPRNSLPQSHAFSLGLAQWIAEHDGRPLPAELRVLITSFDRILIKGNRTELDKWLAQLKPEHNRFVEFRLARQLAALRDVDWSLIRQALETRRYGERVAATNAWSVPWIRSRVRSADRLCLEGARALLDRIGSDRTNRATRLFTQARAIYKTSADEAERVGETRHLCHDLLNRVPYYVKWYQSSSSDSAAHVPAYPDLIRLLDGLMKLIPLLENPHPSGLPEIRRLHEQLTDLKNKVDSELDEKALAPLVTLPAEPGDAQRIEHLLSTPLANNRMRAQLLGAVALVETRLALGIHLPTEYTPPATGEFTAETARVLHRKVELERKLARLADLNLSDLTHISMPEETERDNGAGPILWNVYRELGNQLGRFYRALPAQIDEIMEQKRFLTDPDVRQRQLRRLRAAGRSLGLLDPRIAIRFDHLNPGRRVREIETYEFVLWHRKRFLIARDDAPAAQFNYLTEAARVYGQLASSLLPQISIPPDVAPQVIIDGPEFVSLSTASVKKFEITVRNSSAMQTNVWVISEYDPEIIDVRLLSDMTVYQERRLRDELNLPGVPQQKPEPAPNETRTEDGSELQPIGEYPYRPDPSSKQPTLVLQSGDAETVRFEVRRKKNASRPVRLILKVATRRSYSRHEVEVFVPFPETIAFEIDGVPGSFSVSDETVRLHPFPNQTTNYRFSLRNKDARGKRVNVEILAPSHGLTSPMPQSELSSDDAEQFLARFKPNQSLVLLSDISLPGNGRLISLPFKLPKPDESAKGKGPGESTSKAALAEGADSPTSKKPPASKPRTPLEHGLLVVITDQQTGRKTIRHIDIAPQHPRRYVRPRVGYNVEQQRVEISVVPLDADLIPAGGVQLRCTFAGELPSDSAAQLKAEIKSPDFNARLFADIPTARGRVVTMHLSVDGFPRAFVYRIPCDVNTADIPEETSLQVVQILSPTVGKAFKAPVDSIPVQLRVDAPVGAFENNLDFVEVGIDEDRDREFHNETTLKLFSERQVKVALDRFAPAGLVAIHTQIGDFDINVPASGLQNARVNVLARISAAGREVWSLPIDIILDAAGPRIKRVGLNPRRWVAIGKELEVAIVVFDGQASGVKKVEAAFDVERTGEFGGAAKPMNAVRDAGGRWIAKLPTGILKPGPATLLVRATDRVGNESRYHKVQIRVVTPAKDSALKANLTNRVTGTVFFVEKPASGVQLTLKPAAAPAAQKKGSQPSIPAPQISPVSSDKHGNFTFPRVRPGAYLLTAQALLRNKVRKVELTISVTAPPQRGPDLKIRLQ